MDYLARPVSITKNVHCISYFHFCLRVYVGGGEMVLFIALIFCLYIRKKYVEIQDGWLYFGVSCTEILKWKGDDARSVKLHICNALTVTFVRRDISSR